MLFLTLSVVLSAALACSESPEPPLTFDQPQVIDIGPCGGGVPPIDPPPSDPHDNGE